MPSGRGARELEKQREVAEAEEAKPLRSRRTNSPVEAKRAMERARAEIQATVGVMKAKAKMRTTETAKNSVVENTSRLFASMAMFTLGLVVCGTAPSMEVLVVGRVLQGLGSGSMVVVAYVLVGMVYPSRLQPAVFAAFAGALTALLAVLAGRRHASSSSCIAFARFQATQGATLEAEQNLTRARELTAMVVPPAPPVATAPAAAASSCVELRTSRRLWIDCSSASTTE